MTNKECVEHLKKLKIGIGFLNALIPDDADKDKIDLEALDFAIKALEGWSELKETIEELSENEGVSSQQEVCKFLVNLMGVIEGGRE